MDEVFFLCSWFSTCPFLTMIRVKTFAVKTPRCWRITKFPRSSGSYTASIPNINRRDYCSTRSSQSVATSVIVDILFVKV